MPRPDNAQPHDVRRLPMVMDNSVNPDTRDDRSGQWRAMISAAQQPSGRPCPIFPLPPSRAALPGTVHCHRHGVAVLDSPNPAPPSACTDPLKLLIIVPTVAVLLYPRERGSPEASSVGGGSKDRLSARRLHLSKRREIAEDSETSSALAPVRAPTTGWTRLAPLPAPVPAPASAPAVAQAPVLAPAPLPASAPATAPTIAQETASPPMASTEAQVQPAVTAQRAEEAQGSGTEERPAEDGSQDRNAAEDVAGPADDSARRRRSISSTTNVLPRESPDTSATATSSVRDRYTRSYNNNNNNNNKVLKKKTPMKRRHAPRAKIACLRCGQDERNYDQRKPECERCSRGSFVCTWPRRLPGPRQRVCMRCRQQKMQCDESKPACGKCCRSRSVCVWPEEIATKHGRERHSVSPSPQPLALAPTLFEHNMSSQESRVPNSFCISLEPEY
ncbi:hypothetical protein B0J12DRAFT_386045 [Macrophomina phaseolina]|uniref:Zn(2)-C6 fungal-type domain-containing protein n=1 Tax=Macrophomina phaseolina TaxID=35725 RepID=A0ABQ8FT12_9PEZI|nr:hypothetical protein B0J12DRAFT_386045 [Macrophomina phaseolina]